MAELAEKVMAQLHPLDAVMARLGVGRSTVFELLSSGDLRSVKVGRRRLVSEAALCEFIENLDRENGGAA